MKPQKYGCPTCTDMFAWSDLVLHGKQCGKNRKAVTRLTITVDDLDREACPDDPWTASLSVDTPDGPTVCGVGRTVADALRELAAEIERYRIEF